MENRGMKIILRILGVWAASLAAWSIILDSRDFAIVFLIYGFFFTVPAIIVFLIIQSLERLLLRLGNRWAVLALGPVFGVALPIIFFFAAPNRDNAVAALGNISLLSIICGLVWMLTAWRGLNRPDLAR